MKKNYAVNLNNGDIIVVTAYNELDAINEVVCRYPHIETSDCIWADEIDRITTLIPKSQNIELRIN